MIGLHLAQLGAALTAAITPWIVVRIALEVATRHARTLAQPCPWPTGAILLRRATVIAAVAILTAAFWWPGASRGILIAGISTFVVLSAVSLRVLHHLQLASRQAREVPATTRVASLSARRVAQHLPLGWRLVPTVMTMAGVALLAWRLAGPAVDRRLLGPLAFAAITPIFIWLYDAWIRDTVAGPVAAGATDPAALDGFRTRAVRWLFTAQIVFVVVFLTIAHLLLNLDWATDRGWGAAILFIGGIVGVAGCACAIASDLNRRRYSPVE